MTAVPTSAIAGDPEWLSHRLAPGNELLFRHVTRDRHRAVPFLTDECLGADAQIVRQSCSDSLPAAPVGPVHFIFHSAFCASTLLVRALDLDGIAMGLSEPVILNDIVGRRRRGEIDVHGTGQLFDAALTLLGRPWSVGEAVIIKPSNILNPLAAGLLALRPQAKAIILFAPLETFLVSVARKGMHCRLWARELLEGLIQEGVADLGFTPTDIFRQTDLQCAAVGWLVQHRLFVELFNRYGASRVRSLSSEQLLADPVATLTSAGSHFELAIDRLVASQVAAGPVFSRHSKSGERFDRKRRSLAYEEVRLAHSDEIAMVVEWARAVAVSAGLSFDLAEELARCPSSGGSHPLSAEANRTRVKS